MNSGWKLFLANKGAVFGAVLLIIMAFAGVFGERLYPVSATDIVAAPMSPPSMALPLGADYLGRDVFAGLLHGAGTTLVIGVAATLATVVIGLLIGAIAGFFGRRVDNALMRVTEFFQVLPPILLAMVLVSVFGAKIWNVILVIGLVTWPPLARLTRAEFLKLKEREFIRAEYAMGSSNLNIMFGVLLPNASPPLIVATALNIGTAILFESGLSFLGLSDPDVASWGYMIGSSRDYIFDAWWSVIFPGVAIFLTVLALSLVGDGLNDALNPKLRQR
ncbi:ABC transporter permease [Paralcaligenes ureilyticus]|uniref:Peptide/nickel transport system permease protein n=1 Tax=Paralcaligenes ureilyticus TaxID=627131 RepID=A0A4V2UZ35_9BURK|nr:ABC transporter permease [Paralcaligenes ureilyticus]TCT09758.1 peptide/nickel transport system permease protein [Paralcaligenes ureilyticus]